MPPEKIIERYAQVLVNFALNSGAGVKPGEVVMLAVPDVAKPMLKALQTEVLKAGGHPISRLLPTGMDRSFYDLASEEQLTFFPEPYFKARADLIDHQIGIIAEPNPNELEGIDPKKIFTSQSAKKSYRDWLNTKESAGKFTWTIGLWGVQAKADTVGLSLEEYWQQIIKACYLDHDDPVGEWRALNKRQEELKKALNAMPIQSLHVKGSDVDLVITLGEKRRWQAGSGRNIPSFEVFTSPDWRGTEGWITFDQPLFRYGSVIEGIKLEFKAGKVVSATATKNEAVLKEMIATKDADKIGEFSLTDGSMSRITHFMAETLYDENMGGPQGNTHIAVGMAYQDCYDGDPSSMSTEDWQALGFNDSVVHTDMISTTKRTVTATMKDGSTKIIYTDGSFTF